MPRGALLLMTMATQITWQEYILQNYPPITSWDESKDCLTLELFTQKINAELGDFIEPWEVKQFLDEHEYRTEKTGDQLVYLI